MYIDFCEIKNEIYSYMKHLQDFEEFGYHSEISEDMSRIDRSKERNNPEIEKYKCHKCKSKINKPVYQPALKEIPRLF